jgi:hypothetical protein
MEQQIQVQVEEDLDEVAQVQLAEQGVQASWLLRIHLSNKNDNGRKYIFIIDFLK